MHRSISNEGRLIYNALLALYQVQPTPWKLPDLGLLGAAAGVLPDRVLPALEELVAHQLLEVEAQELKAGAYVRLLEFRTNHTGKLLAALAASAGIPQRSQEGSRRERSTRNKIAWASKRPLRAVPAIDSPPPAPIVLGSAALPPLDPMRAVAPAVTTAAA